MFMGFQPTVHTSAFVPPPPSPPPVQITYLQQAQQQQLQQPLQQQLQQPLQQASQQHIQQPLQQPSQQQVQPTDEQERKLMSCLIRGGWTPPAPAGPPPTAVTQQQSYESGQHLQGMDTV